MGDIGFHHSPRQWRVGESGREIQEDQNHRTEGNIIYASTSIVNAANLFLLVGKANRIIINRTKLPSYDRENVVSE